ncbi:MAG: DUF3326 domain-containing protein [Phycisphaerae bacterium]|jgi:hypothetical protein
MLLIQKEIEIPTYMGSDSLIDYFRESVEKHLGKNEIPVRFAVIESNSDGYRCELGVLSDLAEIPAETPSSIFDFNKREVENTNSFNAVMIVPTGIGCEIGGHAGDAGPAARLLAGACDTLITHPNVVNASDINELPENGLYVEGSVISQMLMGTAGLQKVHSNRVMLVIDKHNVKYITDATVNSVSAARAAMGIDCPLVVELDPSISTQAGYSVAGCATGRVEGLERLCEVLKKYGRDYDAVAIASVIDIPDELHLSYFNSKGEIVNPWGGVEAMLTHTITMLFGVPAAHAPMCESMKIMNLNIGTVDPRISAEAISICSLHCVLKGLHRSPRIITDKMVFTHPGVLTAADISCVVMPDKCLGLPTLAALEQGIPVIAVKENKNNMKNNLKDMAFPDGKLFIVENYLEAAGIMTCLRQGVVPAAVRRPLEYTKIQCERPSSKT